jgi:hypothetical protein
MRSFASTMREDLVAFLLLEKALEVHERRLLIREQRWKLRVEIVLRITLVLAAIAFAGLPVLR